MDGFCPVCGCKTDGLDFVDYSLKGGKAVRVCGFCSKQMTHLNNSLAADAPADEKTAGALRWLDSVIAKEVADREPAVNEELEALSASFGRKAQEQAPVHAQASGGRQAAVIPPVQKSRQPVSTAELEERIDKLEKSFKSFKRNLFLFSLLEVLVPVLILVIIAIIFFKSDLWDSFVALTSPALGGYGGVQIF